MSSRLYFISDTHDIYKGETRYSIGQMPSHTHTSSQIEDFNSTVDSRIQTAIDNIDEIECDTLDANGIRVNGKDVSVEGHRHSVSDISDFPTIGNGVLTIQRNGAYQGQFSANQTSNQTINISVPTQTSQLTNNSDYQTSTQVKSTIASEVKDMIIDCGTLSGRDTDM